MEEDCVGNRYMIFAEDEIWKTYVYIAFLAEKLHFFCLRGEFQVAGCSKLGEIFSQI